MFPQGIQDTVLAALRWWQGEIESDDKMAGKASVRTQAEQVQYARQLMPEHFPSGNGRVPLNTEEIDLLCNMIEEPEELVVLVIHHTKGTNVYAFRTEDQAYGGLAEYCRTWWSEAVDASKFMTEDETTAELSAAPPEDDDELINDYFEHMGHEEEYSIQTVPVNE